VKALEINLSKNWLPVALRGSKPRDIALHVLCGKETIGPAAHAAATQ